MFSFPGILTPRNVFSVRMTEAIRFVSRKCKMKSIRWWWWWCVNYRVDSNVGHGSHLMEENDKKSFGVLKIDYYVDL